MPVVEKNTTKKVGLPPIQDLTFNPVLKELFNEELSLVQFQTCALFAKFKAFTEKEVELSIRKQTVLARTLYVGIDPGATGSVTLYLPNFGFYSFCFKNKSIAEIAAVFQKIRYYCKVQQLSIKCFIELVHSFPGQGVSATFTFGFNTGCVHGILYATGTPFQSVAPVKWMNQIGFKNKGGATKGDKKKALLKYSHQIAAKSCSNLTLKNCDSFLICLYSYSEG